MRDPNLALVIRGLRRTAGLTQGILAQRSGVSERTIRGLESGDIRTPRDATLRALAPCLQLSDERLATLLSGSRPMPNGGRFADLFDHELTVGGLDQQVDHQNDVTRAVSDVVSCQVGTDRAVDMLSLILTFETLESDLDAFRLFQGYDPAFPNPGLIQVRGVANCELLRRVDISPGVCLLEFQIEPHLAAGAVYTLSFDVDFREAKALSGHRAPPEHEVLHGLSHPSAAVAVRTRFANRTHPARVWPVNQSTYAESAGPDTGEVTPNRFGWVEMFVQNPASGVYGLRWSWE